MMPVQPEQTGGDPQVRIAAKEHPVVSLSAGRITVEATVVRAGADLCIVLTGGDRPHIGTVTLSLADSARTSATTSILNCTGHKDGEAAQYLSQRLAATLGATVVVTGGIHVDDIRPGEIKTVLHLVDRLTTTLVDLLTAARKTP
jgi:hypothetical protein